MTYSAHALRFASGEETEEDENLIDDKQPELRRLLYKFLTIDYVTLLRCTSAENNSARPRIVRAATEL